MVLIKLDQGLIENSIDQGLNFLSSHQNSQHLWEDFTTLAGVSNLWVSGYILDKIHPIVGNDSLLSYAAKALLKFSKYGRWWGYNQFVPPDADSTSFVVLGTFPIFRWSEMQKEKAYNFLETHRRVEGYSTYSQPDAIRRFMRVNSNINFDGWCQAHNEVTAAVLLALKKMGISKNSITYDIERLLSKTERKYLMPSYWWRSPFVATALFLRCMHDYNISLDTDKLIRLELDISSKQLKDGSWAPDEDKTPCPFTSAKALEILLYCPGFEKSIDAGVEWLLEKQLPDGSWICPPILRIPTPDCIDPAKVSVWRIDGKGGNSWITAQNRCYTSATIISVLFSVLKRFYG